MSKKEEKIMRERRKKEKKREREREREGEIEKECVCVCVSERESERERVKWSVKGKNQREREREREREHEIKPDLTHLDEDGQHFKDILRPLECNILYSDADEENTIEEEKKEKCNFQEKK